MAAETAAPVEEGGGEPPAARRPDLVIRPFGEDGGYVVKDPRTGEFYNLGPQEAFLLEHFDGRQSAAAIRAAFEGRFGEPLAPDDLNDFIAVARGQGFLACPTAAPPLGGEPPADSAAPAAKADGKSLLFYYVPLFDPDRLFNWLVPRLGFLWTAGFLLASLAVVALAGVVFVSNADDVLRHIPRVTRWETWLLAWLALVSATMLHEFAHGLTCKRYGGEVHEIGFLLLFLLPCFYCDVSEAWLIREKSKRLWVTLAGAYCDLCLWGVAVLVWRVAMPLTLLHYLAWVVMSVCGVRVFFNFNPLIKLDGYYLLSDWMEVPNLRPRSWAYLSAQVRWLLWGAGRPAPEPKAAFLLCYGLASWGFALFYMSLFTVSIYHYLGRGLLGLVGALALAYVVLFPMLKTFAGIEVWHMLKHRWTRTAVWAGVVGGVAALLFLIPIEDRVGGRFCVRAARHVEVRAPLSGFLGAAHADEGDAVVAGAPLLTLSLPDLTSRLAQKQAELAEARAKLRLLEAGPRPEEVREQRQRVARATLWHDLARQDLVKKAQILKEDLARLGQQAGQAQTEYDYAKEYLERSRKLLDRQAMALDKYREVEKVVEVNRAQLLQAQAQRRAREALGTLEDETELARREKDLADAKSALTLLETGPRAEELEAERARSTRLAEEMNYLKDQQQKLAVSSPLTGVVLTARLREKVGQFFKEGDLICELEDPAHLEAEISLEEQDLAQVHPGQPVEFKARALPFTAFESRVDRVAPTAAKAEKVEVQRVVPVYCRFYTPTAGLRSGMTGYARIYCGRRSAGEVLVERVLRYLRTEFWW